MSNLLLQKIVLLRVTEVGKIILKKKRPLLLARSVVDGLALQSASLAHGSARASASAGNVFLQCHVFFNEYSLKFGNFKSLFVDKIMYFKVTKEISRKSWHL